MISIVIDGFLDVLDTVTLYPRPEVNRTGPLPLLVEATCWLAGPAAQARYLDLPLVNVLEAETVVPCHYTMAVVTIGTYQDRPDEAAEVVACCGRLPTIGDVIERSEQLVRLYWRDIERVATALLEHGRLDGDAVRRLIARH